MGRKGNGRRANDEKPQNHRKAKASPVKLSQALDHGRKTSGSMV